MRISDWSSDVCSSDLLQAALRVYNMHGRRDNKFKARIKILVKDLTPEAYAQQVDEQWQLTKGGPDTLTQEYVDTIAGRFTWPAYDTAAAGEPDQIGRAHV